MATGKIVRFEPRGPAGTGLARWPDIAPETLTAGKPVQRGHLYFEDKAIGLSAGVWDCTAMTTKAEPYSVNELMIVLEGSVTIVDARERAVTVKAGESFLIPKGMPCVWRQDAYIRKFFVIFDDASGMAPSDPAVLEVLRPDPQAALAPSIGRRAEATATLIVGTIDGLLMDYLSTGDLARTTRAIDLLAAQLTSRQVPRTRRKR